jgi:hypothetical protein
MSEYRLTPATTLPSLAAQEAKEKRRKVLEAVWQRRRENYRNFRKKMQLQAANKSTIVHEL